jgi:hypothetical protein
MSRQVALLNRTVFRSYVVISPTFSFRNRNDLAVLEEKVEDLAAIENFKITFAYKELINSSQGEFLNDVVLLEKANDQLSQLMGNIFTSVLFYGDRASEYAQWVARTALNCQILILNKSEPDSTMDRYLQNWMKAPRTPS